MRIISIITVLTFLFVSCHVEHEVKNKNCWISTNIDLFSRPGIYLDLTDNDTLYMTENFDFGNLKPYSYHIDSSSQLILNDSIVFGVIKKRTSDILIIEDTIITMGFMPVRNYQIGIDTTELENLLLLNDWQLNEGMPALRIEFYKEPWYTGGHSKIKTYLRIGEYTGWERFECEWWTIEKIENSLYIILSIDQMDYQVYQVKEISDSTILAETCWADSVEIVEFSTLKKLPSDLLITMTEKLIGTWQLTDFKEQVDSSGELGFDEEVVPINSSARNRPYAPEDSVPILFDTYFTEHLLKYDFVENGKCYMLLNNTVLREGTWKLSDDGNYIKIQNGWMPSMRIISFNDSIITTGKHETIEFEKINGWKDKFIIEQLTKK